MQMFATLLAGLVLTSAPPKAEQTIVFAGGCFWGIQSVFEHTKGVTSAVSGYAGGWADRPSYEQVSAGTTGHAESVKVTFATLGSDAGFIGAAGCARLLVRGK